jgi:ABC-type nitrate/sulfonate/bicarbonate transport system permease component
MLIIYASFWQVLVQTLYGVADVDPIADQTARSYGPGPVGPGASRALADRPCPS